MSAAFNHSLLAATDRHESAAFLAELLGLPEPTAWGPFATVTFPDGSFVQFAEPNVEDIQSQHYAFLVDDETFDAVHARIAERGLEHWADPHGTQPGQINTNHGGRGVYFRDPAGHGFEVLTRPYGSTSSTDSSG
jgi:catechol 2,3-dioxygenase-like lactoylglutathione lyase family enzyme